ncbi:MAG: hypothetical protein VW518_09280, partial [Burkholderiaceae bacterium]
MNDLFGSSQLHFKCLIVCPYAFNGFELFEVDSSLRPVSGDSFHLLHQGSWATAIDIFVGRLCQQVPKIKQFAERIGGRVEVF